MLPVELVHGITFAAMWAATTDFAHGVAPGAVMKMPAAVDRYLVAEQKKIMCSRENRFSLAVSRKGHVSPEKHFRMPRSL